VRRRRMNQDDLQTFAEILAQVTASALFIMIPKLSQIFTKEELISILKPVYYELLKEISKVDFYSEYERLISQINRALWDSKIELLKQLEILKKN
jgi:hypothetical protein